MMLEQLEHTNARQLTDAGSVEERQCDYFFFFQAEDGIRDLTVTGVQTCALPISGLLEPRILVGGVIDDQLGDDAQAALVRRVEERAKIVERSVVRIDVEIIGDVRSEERRGRERV